METSTPQPLKVHPMMRPVISPSAFYTFYKGGCPIHQLSQFGPFTFHICFDLGCFAFLQEVSEPFIT
ncbi:hypothetical protein FOFC_02684 [Fusarium oxysporum]|nr:hypothetical protein FOFC_02684 [Fusarium oxysporum]